MAITTQSFLSVGVGASANDGTGDDLRTAFQKVNANFGWIGNTGFSASNIAATTVEVTGNVQAANLVSTFGLWGTVRTAAQASITSVGTLTGLTVSGAVTFSGTTQNWLLGSSQTTGLAVIGGTSATGYINIGRSSSNQAMYIGNGVSTGSAVKTISIGEGGGAGSQTIITVGSNTASARGNIRLNSNVLINNFYVPATATDAGTPGQIVWDSGFVYVCVATNSWKRANLAAW